MNNTFVSFIIEDIFYWLWLDVSPPLYVLSTKAQF